MELTCEYNLPLTKLSTSANLIDFHLTEFRTRISRACVVDVASACNSVASVI